MKKVALVTGAASGIGLALSRELAENGYAVVLVDVNSQALNKAKEQLSSDHKNFLFCECDVSNSAEVDRTITEIITQYSKIDVLINNAGVAIAGSFIHMSEKDLQWLMNINFYGVVNFTRTCLPHMLKLNSANIVNISSIFGVIAPPSQTAYCASKFAVRGFTKSLQNELVNTNLCVSLVYPGGVRTNIAKQARQAEGLDDKLYDQGLNEFTKNLVMPAERAAQIILKGMLAKKQHIYVGKDALLIRLIERLFPQRYWAVLERLLPKSKTINAIKDSYSKL